MNLQKTELSDHCVGCLIGLACGDALGIPFEYWRKEKTAEYLKNHELEMRQFRFGDNEFPAGFYSDDTAQMICLAESLIEKDFDVEDQFARYKRWFTEGYATPDGKCFGVGQRTLRVLISQITVPTELVDEPSAGGNGALMRSAPIALYAHGDFEKIKEYSIRSAIVTHNNEIAAWSCVVLNAAISLLMSCTHKQDVQKKVLKLYSDMPEDLQIVLKTDLKSLSANALPLSGYSLDSLRIALWAFMKTTNFADSMKAIVFLGGDTDTYAAITGAITGAYYGYNGIPAEWKTKLINQERIKALAMQLVNLPAPLPR